MGLIAAAIVTTVALFAINRDARADQRQFLQDPIGQGRARRAAVGALLRGRDHNDPVVRQSQESIARSLGSTGYANATPFLLWTGACAALARSASSNRTFVILGATLFALLTVYQVVLVASALRYQRRHTEP